MRKIDFPENCRYIGMDIVPDLIEENSNRYTSNQHSFQVGDLINSDLPAAEVYFCRDVFIHFPNEMIDKSIKNIRSTGAKFLIATTFPYVTKLVDTEFPLSRHHNLTLVLGAENELLEDFGNNRTDKYMGVWRLDNV